MLFAKTPVEIGNHCHIIPIDFDVVWSKWTEPSLLLHDNGKVILIQGRKEQTLRRAREPTISLWMFGIGKLRWLSKLWQLLATWRGCLIGPCRLLTNRTLYTYIFCFCQYVFRPLSTYCLHTSNAQVPSVIHLPDKILQQAGTIAKTTLFSTS